MLFKKSYRMPPRVIETSGHVHSKRGIQIESAAPDLVQCFRNLLNQSMSVLGNIFDSLLVLYRLGI